MYPDNDDTNPGSSGSGVFFHAGEKLSSPVAPPPLPKRASNPMLSIPSEIQNSVVGIVPSTISSTNISATSISSTAINLFQEMAEPQLAPDASLADKLYFFQTLAQQKSEIVERARILYVSLQRECQALRSRCAQLQLGGAGGVEHATQLKALQELVERESIRTQEAENKAVALKAQVGELEEERKDLARALAEVEGQYSQFKQSMEGAVESRKQMEEELVKMKEELVHTQEQVAELAAERADMAGQLEATTEGYESCVREAEQFAAENENLRLEIEAYKSSFGQHQSNELHLMTAELKELRERVEASESEQRWLEQSLERSETRVQELEAALQARPEQGGKGLEVELEATRAELERVRVEFSASQKREFSVGQEVTELSQEKEALETRLQSLQRELEGARQHTQESPSFSQPNADVLNELRQLRETVVLLKKRLMVAEAAAEAAAGLKSKVARLESMLRQGGR